ncbi:PepSY-associated TM helix domain-containing protein [Bacillus sp. 1P10SD]|uniref:PepSY-associated TM helix domain-containing protein n=1 Tax=Bacillus sp. 1P10SD TaxID=3132265 RepID=UPI0039A50EB7
MKKTRTAHLWIGLIASVLILMESITGLIMNEPWLIGQSQMEGNKGNFQPGQFNQGRGTQGSTSDTNQAGVPVPGQTQEQTNGGNLANNQNQPQAGGQTQGTTGSNPTGQFPAQGGPGAGFPGRDGASQGSLMSIIKGLHEGRIGNTDVKWLIDLTAIAMIFLTGSGIYLSLKVLRVGKKRRKTEEQVA